MGDVASVLRGESRQKVTRKPRAWDIYRGASRPREGNNMKGGIVGVQMDLGQRRRGVDMGPTAIRIAGLDERIRGLKHRVQDFGNIPGPDRSGAVMLDERLRYLGEVLTVCKLLAARVSQMVSGGAFPLVLGGDQSISIGTLAGLAG